MQKLYYEHYARAVAERKQGLPVASDSQLKTKEPNTMGPFKYGRTVVGGVLGAGVAAVAILLITQGIQRHERGIYAGYSYGQAKTAAATALAKKYGLGVASNMQLGRPDVVNTHSNTLLQNGQIRVFNLVGARGVKYCVSVRRGSLPVVTKGCHISATPKK